MEESGLDLANKINKMQNPPHIIFATAHDTFAVKAFELDATDYILKPFEQNVLHRPSIKLKQRSITILINKQMMSASIKMMHKENTPTSQMVLPIEVDERIHIINLEDIIAISVNNGITTINTLQENYHTTEPLNHYEKNCGSFVYENSPCHAC